MAQPAPAKHRISVAELTRMATAGVFHEDARIELIDGELYDMAPIGSSHAGTVDYLAQVLNTRLAGRAIVRVQNPIVLGDLSAPQPDLALLHPRADFYRSAHPTAADTHLVIEVAESSLDHDRNTKIPLYARHGIREAWLVDLEARRLLRFTEPGPTGYRRQDPVTALNRMQLSAFPGIVLDLSALF
jgi:Uma2 family endonuclease